MKLRTSFRRKLLLLSVAPLAVAQVVTLIAVMHTVAQDVQREARESLKIGAAVVDEYLSSRQDHLRTSVEVLAADFGLKQAVAIGDANTMRSVLENHSQRVGADLALTLDLAGRATASTDEWLHSTRPVLSGIAADAERLAAYQSIARFDEGVYQTFAVPLRAPLPIGWVVLGFRIDSGVIDRLGALTGMDAALVSPTSGEVLLTAGSLRPPDELGPGTESVFVIEGADDARLATLVPFAASPSSAFDVAVLLQRSMTEAMAPYEEARRGLVAFTILLLLVVALAAAWVSGGIARPVQVLTGAARRMMAGRYDEAISVESSDEVGELAASFKAMQKAIAEREQRISHQATHEPLTGLPNRSSTIEQIAAVTEAAGSAGREVQVLLIRLSRLEAITSTLGHSAADDLVRHAARHLEVNLETGEFLGHVGKGEFVLVVPDSSLDDGLARAEKLHAILESGVTLGRTNISLQTDTGIAGYPQHGDQADHLLRNAAMAGSEARARREPVAVFQPGRDDYHLRRLRIVNDLRGALHREEIEVWFQPKIALPERTPSGAEALVRWNHPEFGWLPPDEFIVAAEEAGNIVHLTRYVLKRAIRECRSWHDKGFPLQVSVNISARDLSDDYLPYYVLQLLQEYSVPPWCLTLEVTEHAVMEETARAVTVLDCLQDIGIRTSMDDFGTGQSSLAQLGHLPLDELKVDKGFVADLVDNDRNMAIVDTTLELAWNLNLSVVAEGVGDAKTLGYLSEAGCEHAQGYFLSRPLEGPAFLEWLLRQSGRRLEAVEVASVPGGG